jgi:acetylglutamate synthase
VPGFFERPPLAVYVEKEYRGAAILEPGPVAPYLTKFVVEPFAQGDGLGQELWQAITRDHPSLLWRCRPQNWVRKWYASVCDGLQRLPEWHVFWRGLDPERIPAAVADAMARPRDLEP